MSKRKKLWKKKEERVAHEKREGRESSCPKNLERERRLEMRYSLAISI
jgi:hypothetical protein